METEKQAKTYRLSARALELIAAVKTETGKNATQILEEAIREYARKKLKNTQ